MSLTPAQRSQRGRAAALARWGNTPPAVRQAVTRPGRDAVRARYVAEVADQFPGLPARDQAILVTARIRAHMVALALRSSQARAAS